MNILMIPQLSMRSYEEDRYFIMRDAQMNKCKGMLKVLADRGHDIFLVVSSNKQTHPSDYKIFDCYESKSKGITFVQVEHMKNVLANRYMFDLSGLCKLLSEMPKIDFCINEIVPLTKPLYAMQSVYLGYEFPIASCIEHMTLVPENTLSEKLDHFSVEAVNLMVSDLAVFPMENMLSRFMDEMKRFFRVETLENWHSKVRIWNHYFSYKEIDSKRQHLSFKTVEVGLDGERLSYSPNDKIILFGSRLSDEKRTKYNLFFEVINELWKQRQDFRVIVANPNEAQSWDWVKDKMPTGSLDEFIINKGDDAAEDRKRWINTLERSKIVPILYPMDELYSVGCQEALYCKSHILTPRLSETREGMPDLDYEGYFDSYSVKELVSKMNTLLDLEDSEIEDKLSEISKTVSGEMKAPFIEEQMREIIERKKK